MPLKRKIAVFGLAFFFVFLTARYFKTSQRLPAANAKIRIETKFSDQGEPLLLTQAKGITQQTTLEELLRRLNLLSSSLEKNQQKILEIQKQVQVVREGNTEIFNIVVRHPDPKWSREVASQLAQAFQTVELLEERRQAEAEEASLERQTAAALEEINMFEKNFKEIKNANTPGEVDVALANRLQEKQSKYAAMSETYTSLHPDMIELEKEMESLKLQIMDGPPLDMNAVSEAENKLREADSRYRQLRQKADEARLQKKAVTGHVTILEISSKTNRKTEKINPLYLAATVIILILAVILRIVSR